MSVSAHVCSVGLCVPASPLPPPPPCQQFFKLLPIFSSIPRAADTEAQRCCLEVPGEYFMLGRARAGAAPCSCRHFPGYLSGEADAERGARLPLTQAGPRRPASLYRLPCGRAL